MSNELVRLLNSQKPINVDAEVDMPQQTTQAQPSNELLELLKKRKQDSMKESAMALIAGGIGEALSGDTGGSIANYGGQLAQSRMARGDRLDDLSLKAQIDRTAKAKPLTKSNVIKTVGPDGSPVITPIQEAIGKEAYENGFYLDEKKDLAEFTSGLSKGKDGSKIATDLRKERGSLPITKDTQKVVSAYDRVLSGASGENAASDVGMVFAFMKMLDPGSVVRESEQVTGRKARGFEEAMGNLSAWFKEGRTLTKSQIKRFVGTAKDIYSRQLKLQKRADNYYRKEAKKLGVDVESAIGPQFASSPEEPESPALVEQDGNIFKLVNGEYKFFKKAEK